jgi:hypothetical protein
MRRTQWATGTNRPAKLNSRQVGEKSAFAGKMFEEPPLNAVSLWQIKKAKSSLALDHCTLTTAISIRD